ncbi:MAG: general secretion pathway protein GspB [Candidatus Mariimomonas ferrooxydans]
MTVHDLPTGEPNKRPLWPYLLLAALLLNAVLISAWLGTRQSEKSQSAHGTALIKPVREPADINLQVPAMSSENTLSQQLTAAGEDTLPGEVKAGSMPGESLRNVLPRNQPGQAKADIKREVPAELDLKTDAGIGPESIPAKQEQALIITPPPAEPQPPLDIDAEPEQGVVDIDKLPSSVREGLPNMSISGHIYSNKPASRIVAINSQVLREGEDIAAGLKLEEITPTGVILSYKGLRFRIKVF